MDSKKITQVIFAVPNAPQPKRVAAYARVSSGKDAMLQSLSAQISYYSELIQKHAGWQYIGVYADEAKTGTKDSRENFQRLLSDCRKGIIDMVLTKSISRFARNTVTLLETVRELKSLGIDVFFEEQNIHSISTDGELMLTILASYTQEESLSASENQKWRIRKNFEEGKPWDCTMLGYRVKDGVFEIIPGEAKTVRLVFEWYLSGLGKQAIANKLNEIGVATRFNRSWHEDTIRKILQNEKYSGDLLLQKTFRTDCLSKQKQVNRGELPMFHVQEAHEPIIDRAIFDAVQKEIARRAVYYKVKPGNITAFSAKIRCGICGKNYRRKTTPTGFVWICATLNFSSKKNCTAKQIPESTLMTISAEVLGIDAFNDKSFNNSVSYITALSNNTLEYHFLNGSTKAVQWKDRSRRESWTDEMRQAAREKTMRRNGTWHEQ